eukprot:g34817.t1
MNEPRSPGPIPYIPLQGSMQGYSENSQASAYENEYWRKKKFIFTLVAALHKAGNWSFDTQNTLRNIAKVLHLNCTCLMMPAAALVSFNSIEGELTASTSESYHIPIEAGWDFNRLAALDQLCHSVYRGKIGFAQADKELAEIVTAKDLYPTWAKVLAMGVASASTAGAFFGGQLTDLALSFAWGIIVAIVTQITYSMVGVAEIESFISAFLISYIGSLVDLHVFEEETCLYAQLLGGTVWLLPGVSITMSLMELYSNMVVFGSSRFVSGLGQSLQLGLGLAVGYKLALLQEGLPLSFEGGCEALPHYAPLPTWASYLLVPVAILSMDVIVETNAKQVFGTLLCGSVAYIIPMYLKPQGQVVGANTVPLVAALGMGLTARAYGRMIKHRPIIYVIGGTLVLVPGSVGVRGITAAMSGDGEVGGMELTFTMFVVGLCIGIGVFLARLPRKNWRLYGQHSFFGETPMVDNAEDDEPDHAASPYWASRLNSHDFLSRLSTLSTETPQAGRGRNKSNTSLARLPNLLGVPTLNLPAVPIPTSAGPKPTSTNTQHRKDATKT